MLVQVTVEEGQDCSSWKSTWRRNKKGNEPLLTKAKQHVLLGGPILHSEIVELFAMVLVEMHEIALVCMRHHPAGCTDGTWKFTLH